MKQHPGGPLLHLRTRAAPRFQMPQSAEKLDELRRCQFRGIPAVTLDGGTTGRRRAVPADEHRKLRASRGNRPNADTPSVSNHGVGLPATPESFGTPTGARATISPTLIEQRELFGQPATTHAERRSAAGQYVQ